MAQQTEPARTGGPWEPPPPRPHKRLYRRTDDKVIAGVASGLADYFEIDPVLVRIGFVILAIAGGAGIVAYGVMWWMVPPTHEVSGPGEDVIRRLKRAPAWVAVAMLVVGGVLLANQLGPRHEDLVWGLGLIALGVLLFWNTSVREGPPSRTARRSIPARPPPRSRPPRRFPPRRRPPAGSESPLRWRRRNGPRRLGRLGPGGSAPGWERRRSAWPSSPSGSPRCSITGACSTSRWRSTSRCR